MTTELEQIFREAPLAPTARASASVVREYEKATGKQPSGDVGAGNGNKRIPGAEDDCPICYDGMHGVPEASLVFCEQCGNALHKDCFGEWLGEIPIIRDVGIDPGVGPGNAQSQRWGGGGFDMVTMMFCMHYAFENEEKARGMLRNVSGALKKGGRFIGVMPNSDVIVQHVKEALGGTSPTSQRPEEKKDNGGSDDNDDDDWDPEKPSEQPNTGAEEDDGDDWDPEKPSEEQPNGTEKVADVEPAGIVIDELVTT